MTYSEFLFKVDPETEFYITTSNGFRLGPLERSSELLLNNDGIVVDSISWSLMGIELDISEV